MVPTLSDVSQVKTSPALMWYFQTYKEPIVLTKENLSSSSVIINFLLLRVQKASHSMCFPPQTENLGFIPFFFKCDIFLFLNSRNLPQFVKLIWCFDGGNLAPRTGSVQELGLCELSYNVLL